MASATEESPSSNHLDVHLETGGATVAVGQVWFQQRRRGPVTSVFQYRPDYLARSGSQPVDPQLPLVSGNQYLDHLPGAFQDCSPDRWGRNLIEKRHRLVGAADARQAGLNDVDFLVGVSDVTRQGALRFTEAGLDTFLHPDRSVPKLLDLQNLLSASNQLAESDDDL